MTDVSVPSVEFASPVPGYPELPQAGSTGFASLPVLSYDAAYQQLSAEIQQTTFSIQQLSTQLIPQSELQMVFEEEWEESNRLFHVGDVQYRKLHHTWKQVQVAKENLSHINKQLEEANAARDAAYAALEETRATTTAQVEAAEASLQAALDEAAALDAAERTVQSAEWEQAPLKEVLAATQADVEALEKQLAELTRRNDKLIGKQAPTSPRKTKAKTSPTAKAAGTGSGSARTSPTGNARTSPGSASDSAKSTGKRSGSKGDAKRE